MPLPTGPVAAAPVAAALATAAKPPPSGSYRSVIATRNDQAQPRWASHAAAVAAVHNLHGNTATAVAAPSIAAQAPTQEPPVTPTTTVVGGAAVAMAAVAAPASVPRQQAAPERRPTLTVVGETPPTPDNRSLELRLYHDDRLLAMHHYTKPETITIGEGKRATIFMSSDELPETLFPLVRYIDEEYVLSFTKRMSGEVELGGAVHGLAELIRGRVATRDDSIEDTYQLRLPLDARVAVHWGGFTFAMRFVTAPRYVPPPWWQALDLAFLKSLAGSFGLHTVWVSALLLTPVDVEEVKDLEQMPHIVQMIMEQVPRQKMKVVQPSSAVRYPKMRRSKPRPPTEQPVEQPQKQDAKAMADASSGQERGGQNKAGGKTGAKAGGAANTSPLEPPPEKAEKMSDQFASFFDPGGNGAGSLLRGGGGRLTGILQSAIGTVGTPTTTASVAGLGVRNPNMPNTGGGGVGDRRGFGNPGNDGHLGGGNPSVTRGAGQIVTAGRYGGSGTGYGREAGGMGRGRERDMLGLGTPVVMGSLPADVIRRIINENKAQIRHCYEKELQKNQSLAGRIAVRWIIGATGSVTYVMIKESVMRNANVEACMMSRIKTWKFPMPAGGGQVEVNYPFVFTAS